MPFGDNDQTFRVDMQADRPVSKAGRNRVAIAIKGDQTRGRHAFAQFDKAIEGCGQRHQIEFLSLPDIGNAAGQSAMRSLNPQHLATLFQPVVEGIKV